MSALSMFKRLAMASVVISMPLLAKAQTAPYDAVPYGNIYPNAASHVISTGGRAYFQSGTYRYVDGWVFFWVHSTADYSNFTGSAYYVFCPTRISFKVATTLGTNFAEMQNNVVVVAGLATHIPTISTSPLSLITATRCENAGAWQ